MGVVGGCARAVLARPPSPLTPLLHNLAVVPARQIVPNSSSLYTLFYSVIYNSVTCMFTVFRILYNVYNVFCLLYSVPLYSVHCTQYSVCCTVYTIHHSVLYTKFSAVHCILYTVFFRAAIAGFYLALGRKFQTQHFALLKKVEKQKKVSIIRTYKIKIYIRYCKITST